MSLSTGPSLAAAETSPSALRFGRVCASPAGTGSIRWDLARPCSMTPAQNRIAFMLLAGVSLSVAVLATALGATFALPFAGVELALVAWALAVHARHASDREAIELAAGRLTVERCDGTRTERVELNGAWARIEPACGHCALIGICGQGRRIEVGRFVRPELRPQLARELRGALRAQPDAARSRDKHETPN